MIHVEIPGRGRLVLAHLALDLNGTIVRDGVLLPGVAERIAALRDQLAITLLTADTHGRAVATAEALGIALHRIAPSDETAQKAAFVRRTGAQGMAAIGNGANDAAMLAAAVLGIAVLGDEGLAGAALLAADVVAPGIAAALDLLLTPDRLRATLRI
ncbi:MAG TPA: HAD family hydrolase [Anaerolineae bacterium]|nr:HAD family hydrolase [Anaerolineae bacterium]HPL27775.1 HAD family hydrolase [Anaerolineae bacterium]